MANRTIEAILRLSSKLGNMAAFQQLAGHLAKVDKQAKDFNRRQSMIVAGARDMHATLLRYAAPAALAYGAKQAFVDFAELERRMTRIGITAGASVGETREAFDVLQRSAKDFAMPIDEAVEGLDTLVSSGMSLKEALAFLPSVLATAQAAGATTTDIANTAQKAASALGLQAGEMQRAFDIMVTGGKAGQFELKDMAAYIPELANSFASLGYKGEEGLKELVAILQTIREDTGSAGAAATQAQNIFGKMFSQETANKFDDFGINLRKEMEAAKAAGEDAVTAFVRLSKEAVDGDLSKLPLLFTDQEFRLGMQSLMTSADSYKRFIDTVNNSEVEGSTLRDLGRVLDDNKSKIDRMGASWDKLKTSFGAGIADPVGGFMDGLSDEIDYATAVNAGLEKNGVSGFAARTWWGLNNGQKEKDEMAYLGGYRTEEQRQAEKASAQNADTRREAGDGPFALEKDEFGMPVAGPVPMPRPVAHDEKPVPIPSARPSADVIAKDNFDREFDAYQAAAAKTRRDMRQLGGEPPATAQVAPAPAEPGGWKRLLFGDLADGVSLREAMSIDAPVLKPQKAQPPEQPRPVVVAAPPQEAPSRESLRPIVAPSAPVAAPMAVDTRPPTPVTVPEARSRTEAPAPTFREAENASMSMLRQDHSRIANEIEMALSTGGTQAGDAVTQGGDAVGQGGEDAGTSIREAARAINEAGGEAGATFRAMIEGIGRQIGAEMAASFKQNVGTVPVKAQVVGGAQMPAARPGVSGERGRTMPQAGGTPKP